MMCVNPPPYTITAAAVGSFRRAFTRTEVLEKPKRTPDLKSIRSSCDVTSKANLHRE
ncbi:Uncharacterized protein DAT39_019325, partial [Clarias magur]